MPCIQFARGCFICQPSYSSIEVHLGPCFDPKCKKNSKDKKNRRYHIIAFENYYGFTRCCMSCGRVSRTGDEGWLHDDLPPGRGCADRQRDSNKKAWTKRWLGQFARRQVSREDQSRC